MVGRFWVDDWWRGRLLVDSFSGPSSSYKHWLILLDGIARVGFELGTRWVPNVRGK
jgi:hypothetical protein